MKKFIRNTFYFCIGLLICFSFTYYLINGYLNSSFKKNDVVFVWGDSQVYRGIDIKELSSTLKKPVFSSAHSGAGVYDFLLFTQQVPENATTVVAISKLTQIRRKEVDYNQSGLSFFALKKLYDHNYTPSEVFSIFKANIKPKTNISQENRLLPYSDSMKMDLPISHFKNYYDSVPSFLGDKQDIYLAGIANLIDKNCTIHFLEFPYHPILAEIETQSPIKPRTEAFKQKVASLFQEFTIDSIHLEKEQNIFSDLSHLNRVGANDLSKKLGMRILNNERPTLYIAY